MAFPRIASETLEDLLVLRKFYKFKEINIIYEELINIIYSGTSVTRKDHSNNEINFIVGTN